jgi:hypothetical protein
MQGKQVAVNYRPTGRHFSGTLVLSSGSKVRIRCDECVAQLAAAAPGGHQEELDEEEELEAATYTLPEFLTHCCGPLPPDLQHMDVLEVVDLRMTPRVRAVDAGLGVTGVSMQCVHAPSQ